MKHQAWPSNGIKPMFLGIAVLLVLVMSSSGCIQTQLGRELFFKEDEPDVEYGVEDILTTLNYEFKNSNLMLPVHHEDQENFVVEEDALWFLISIQVDFKIYLPSSADDHLEFGDYDDRSLSVIITDPDGNQDSYFFESTALLVLEPEMSPMPGLWKVRIDVTGRGFVDINNDEYYDSYSVSGKINQPI